MHVDGQPPRSPPPHDPASGDDDGRERPAAEHVIREEVKERHTTHWDEDYLPTAEVERLHRAGQRELRRGRLLRGLAVVAVIVLVAALAVIGWQRYG